MVYGLWLRTAKANYGWQQRVPVRVICTTKNGYRVQPLDPSDYTRDSAIRPARNVSDIWLGIMSYAELECIHPPR